MQAAPSGAPLARPLARLKPSTHAIVKEKQRIAILYAVLAAALYALAIPFSKIALKETPPAMTAALLYLGAGTGMALTGWIRKQRKISWKEAPLTRKDTPYIVGMVALDIAAPILLMLGLTWATAAEASLLNNFEIVATAVFALWLFGEKVSCRLWTAIGLITLASMLLAANSTDHFSFSPGALLVLAAAACWGLENNCTRKLSAKDPLEIVVIKGLGSGLGSLAIALSIGEAFPEARMLPAILLLGFVAYGLSIFFYVYAQRYIGAAQTSAYYALAPFIGVFLSFLLLGERPGGNFFLALAVMTLGTYLAAAKRE